MSNFDKRYIVKNKVELMDYEPNEIDYDEEAVVRGTIVDSDLTHEMLEALARIVVDGWDMDTLVDYAVSTLFDHYQSDIDLAVKDANDFELTVEDLES